MLDAGSRKGMWVLGKKITKSARNTRGSLGFRPLPDNVAFEHYAASEFTSVLSYVKKKLIDLNEQKEDCGQTGLRPRRSIFL